MTPGVVLSNSVSQRPRSALAESLSWDLPDPNIMPSFGGTERFIGGGAGTGTATEGGSGFAARWPSWLPGEAIKIPVTTAIGHSTTAATATRPFLAFMRFRGTSGITRLAVVPFAWVLLAAPGCGGLTRRAAQ